MATQNPTRTRKAAAAKAEPKAAVDTGATAPAPAPAVSGQPVLTPVVAAAPTPIQQAMTQTPLVPGDRLEAIYEVVSRDERRKFAGLILVKDEVLDKHGELSPGGPAVLQQGMPGYVGGPPAFELGVSNHPEAQDFQAGKHVRVIAQVIMPADPAPQVGKGNRLETIYEVTHVTAHRTHYSVTLVKDEALAASDGAGLSPGRPQVLQKGDPGYVSSPAKVRFTVADPAEISSFRPGRFVQVAFEVI